MNTTQLPRRTVVYGITNCDTVKKARVWLAEHGVDTDFHDFKKMGVPAQELPGWISAVGWEKLLNRKGTTWRKLDAALQASVTDAETASAVMLSHPSAIKRPVVVWDNGTTTVGFDAATFEKTRATRLP